MASNQPDELEQIPGIGPARAEALREADFQTLADLQEASQEDLVGVERIDEILARDIKATVSPSLSYRRKPEQTNYVTPEEWELTDRQITYLEELSNERLQEFVGGPALDLVDQLEWRIDPELLRFEKVCGRVVKKDESDEKYPVPNATVHIYDTDCNFLSYFPTSSLWGWFYPFGCHREKIATVTTNDCGEFCVYLPGWDIDRILEFRRDRICLPEIVAPRIRDVLDQLEPQPEPPIDTAPRVSPEPVPSPLREPGVYNQLTGLIGQQTTDRLFALTSQSSFGDSPRELDDLLDQTVPTEAIDPPLPRDLTGIPEGQQEEVRSETTAIDQLDLENVTPRDFIGPFLRCRDAFVPVWTTIFDVPDITFEVTQDIDGDGTEETIYSDGFFDVRWNEVPESKIVLEASDLALGAPQCDPGVEIPDCGVPEFPLIGSMPLAPGYHSNSSPREGYAVKVNRPRTSGPGREKPASTPYSGRLNLYGCGFRTEDAEYYRVVYRYRKDSDDSRTGVRPFMDSDWFAVRENTPPVVERIQPVNDEGWYEIPDPAVLTDRYQNLLLHWNTRGDNPHANGLYDIRLELADGSKEPLDVHSDWVTFWVDNTRPRANFDDLTWQTKDGSQSGEASLSCPVIKWPIGADGTRKTIDIEVSYTVQHRHLRNLSLDAHGCGGGEPDQVGPDSDFQFWYSDADDTYHTVNDATFRFDDTMSPGAYNIELVASSRAFNPTRATKGMDKNNNKNKWDINPRHVWKLTRLPIAIVNKT